MRGEFFSANEYNKTSEYKHFPAEMYVKPKEENLCGKEEAKLGDEITTLQEKKAPKSRADSQKTVTNKILDTIRGFTTSGVVVASLVVTSAVATSPEAKLISLDYTDTYVEYQMEVTGLDADGDYAIVLSTAGEEDIELEVEGEGTYRHRVDGLKPNCDYNLSFIRVDTLIGDVSVFSASFRTLKHVEQEPMPPPEPEPEPEPEPIPTPIVTVNGVEIVGLDEIEIRFTHEDVPAGSSVELALLFGDMTSDKLTLSEEDMARGYVRAAMQTSDTVTVTPTVTVYGEGETVTECDGYTETFDETFSVDVLVSLTDRALSFYPIGITGGAEYMSITSSAAPDSPESLWLEGAINVWYETEEVITYTMYLTNEEGEMLSDKVELTVDTSVTAPKPDYNFVYYNPGEITVTYNDDGTVNMYIPTQFESEDESVYYQITYGGNRYVSREPIARIEYVEDESYPITYDVCVDIDGVQYSIYRVTPSGSANESWLYFDRYLEGNTLTLSFDKELLFLDLDSLRLVSDTGEEILLSESDFTYNEEYGNHEVTVEFAEIPESVVIYFMANPYYNEQESIDGCVGNVRKTFEETVYQP